MDVGKALLDILVVLVAAKLAAEGAERLKIPAVVGEIIAGIIVGPSLLGLVGTHDDVLRTLGELGVILLLVDVGLEMDIAELGAVGRASLLTATVGVVAPLLLGLGAMELIGDDFNTALFVAAALTATSVGITARVFGDLKALATTEARIVLGAAVADDVMGLVVLTVVVRIVTEGSISALSVFKIVAIAVAFLVVGTLAAARIAPPAFGWFERYSLSAGTVMALALAFTLAMAQFASGAQLAPIVGAFVAGLALNRTRQSERIRRELAPVGHVLIPIFFVSIGIETHVRSFASLGVLRDAAILFVVAVIGKLLSPLGSFGTSADRMLIGIGMLPRGEVGLIFASIGLNRGVLDQDLYAALLLVVLASTLVTPPLLRLRLRQVQARSRRNGSESDDVAPSVAMPNGGWLAVRDGAVVLRARPPAHLALVVGLNAARLVADAAPSGELLDWVSGIDRSQLRWSHDATNAFLELVEHGNARSWRFLEATAVLDAAFPEFADALRDRRVDPNLLDPTKVHTWETVDRLRAIVDRFGLSHPERLELAALLVDATAYVDDRDLAVRRILRRLDLDATTEQDAARLVADADLLWSAARRPDGLTEHRVHQLASHLDRPDFARSAYVLALARNVGRPEWERERLTELNGLVQEVLADDRLVGREARNLVGSRRVEAARSAGGVAAVVARIDDAPGAFTLARSPGRLADDARLLERLSVARSVAVSVEAADTGPSTWFVTIAMRRRPFFFAAAINAVTGPAGGLDLPRDTSISSALVATWPDFAAIVALTVRSPTAPDSETIAARIESFAGPASTDPVPDAAVEFDATGSPWHTVCDVGAADAAGLLHRLALAFVAAGVEVHAAEVQTADGRAHDRFDLTVRGGKLGAGDTDVVRRCITDGVRPRRGFVRSRRERG